MITGKNKNNNKRTKHKIYHTVRTVQKYIRKNQRNRDKLQIPNT